MKYLLLLMCALTSWGATTTVYKTIVGPDGQPATGDVIITISAPCTSGAASVQQQPLRVHFVAGKFQVKLVPNDSCSPGGTSYMVSWVLSGTSAQRTEYWVVPTSATPVTVDSVIIAPQPVPPYPLFNLSQINGGNATPGLYCIQINSDHTLTLSTSCPGGGGPGTLLWSTLTNTQWTSLTDLQWTTLGN